MLFRAKYLSFGLNLGHLLASPLECFAPVLHRKFWVQFVQLWVQLWVQLRTFRFWDDYPHDAYELSDNRFQQLYRLTLLCELYLFTPGRLGGNGLLHEGSPFGAWEE